MLLLPALARAQEDPDTQAARRHFTLGQQLYEQERYDDAVREFMTAKELKPIPAFDYNIGRCLDRLERWSEAADAYQRYLTADPHSAGAAELEQRIAVLRARTKSEAKPPTTTPPATPATVTPATANVIVAAPPPARRPVYKRAWFWVVVGGGAVAIALGVGLGLTLGHAGDASHPIGDVRF